MADTGVKYSATRASSAEAPYDDVNIGVTNWGADDGNVSGISSGFTTDLYSYVAKCSNFSAGVPAGATINGIKVEAELLDYGGTSYDVLVQLSKDNSTRVGDNKARNANLANSLGTIYIYGGSADLWGTTWTAAEVNSANFAVHIAGQSYNADAGFFADFIRITIYYTEGGAPVTGTASVTLDELQTATITKEAFKATVAVTIDELQGIAAAKETFKASAAVILEETQTTAVAKEGISGTGAVILDEIQIAAITKERIIASGTLNLAETAITAAGVSLLDVVGEGAITLAGMHIAATGAAGAQALIGIGAVAFNELQTVASAAEMLIGAADVSFLEAQAAISAKETIVGQGAVVGDLFTLAVSGEETITGQGAVELNETQIAGDGAVANPGIYGIAAIVLGELQAAITAGHYIKSLMAASQTACASMGISQAALNALDPAQALIAELAAIQAALNASTAAQAELNDMEANIA